MTGQCCWASCMRDTPPAISRRHERSGVKQSSPLGRVTFCYEREALQVEAVIHGLLRDPSRSAPGEIDKGVAISLPRPGQLLRKTSVNRFFITPDSAVAVLRSYVPSVLGLTQMREEDVRTGRARHIIEPLAWFLDNYWPILRRGIGRVMTQCRWPPRQNPLLRLLPTVDPDSMYATLGVITIDGVQQALFGRTHTPFLSVRPSEPPEPGQGDSEKVSERCHHASRESERLSERRRWMAIDRYLSSLGARSLPRLNALGAASRESIIVWDRGLLAELDSVLAGAVARDTQPLHPQPQPKRREKQALSLEARVLGILADRPDLKDKQIAELAGCARPSLYRLPKFVEAKRVLKSGRLRMPRGAKDVRTGAVEAVDDRVQ